MKQGLPFTPLLQMPEKRKGFDRALQRALLYSLLFHGFIFGFIKIKYLDVHAIEAPLRPIEVAIEKEDHLTIAAITNEENTTHFLPSKELIAPHTSSTEPLIAYALQQDPAGVQLEEIFDDEISHSLYEKKPLVERIYPLSLKYSHSLSKLKVEEDGSQLFRNKTAHESSSLFALTTQHYAISYEVSIDPENGKIIHWSRKKELINKKLQNLADLIINKIKFAPFPVTRKDKKSKIREGKISITFHASGDAIEGYLI